MNQKVFQVKNSITFLSMTDIQVMDGLSSIFGDRLLMIKWLRMGNTKLSP